MSLALLVLLGCTYTLRVVSEPSPALVQLQDGRRISTPGEVKLRWRPLRRTTATVTAAGYRPLEVALHRLRLRSGRAFSGQRGEVLVVLVPEHGPVGTWSADEVPRR